MIEIDPQNGKLVSTIDMKGQATNITSVAFGGEDYNDLYITSSNTESPPGSHEGSLFVARIPGVKGLKASAFKKATATATLAAEAN